MNNLGCYSIFDPDSGKLANDAEYGTEEGAVKDAAKLIKISHKKLYIIKAVCSVQLKVETADEYNRDWAPR